MSKGTIAGREPIQVELDPGTFYWCACGLSKNQPYCDGSHQGSAFTPVQVELKRSKKLWLCTCKQTSSPPYCDGTHNSLDPDSGSALV